jgi:hypothetical protein
MSDKTVKLKECQYCDDYVNIDEMEEHVNKNHEYDEVPEEFKDVELEEINDNQTKKICTVCKKVYDNDQFIGQKNKNTLTKKCLTCRNKCKEYMKKRYNLNKQKRIQLKEQKEKEIEDKIENKLKCSNCRRVTTPDDYKRKGTGSLTKNCINCRTESRKSQTKHEKVVPLTRLEKAKKYDLIKSYLVKNPSMNKKLLELVDDIEE